MDETLAWEDYAVIDPDTLARNTEFYRDLSLAALGLGVVLLLIATWRTFGPRVAEP